MNFETFLHKQHITLRRLNRQAQRIKDFCKTKTSHLSPKINALYKQYGKKNIELFNHFYPHKLKHRVKVKYLPLCIIFFLHDKDYQMVFRNSTNGCTRKLDGFSIIVMTTRNPHLKRTLNHELHHVIFDFYYSLDRTVLYKVEYIVKHYKSNLAKHKWYAKKMNLRMHEESRTEFFAWAANHTTLSSATGLSLNYWPQKLRRVQKTLDTLTDLNKFQRKQIMTIYLHQYKEYLDDVYHYQCFVDWLFTFYENKQINLSVVLSTIALQSMKDIKSVSFPTVNTTLKRYVQRKQKITSLVG